MSQFQKAKLLEMELAFSLCGATIFVKIIFGA